MKTTTRFLLLLALTALACNFSQTASGPASSPTPPPALPLSPAPATDVQTPPSLSLVKKVVITTDVEGGSARPEIAVTTDRVFILYLGNIGAGNARTFSLKIYDANLDAVIASKALVATTPEYGGPTDIRVMSDGQFLYAFYETHKPTAPGSATTYLWGAKYALDDNFDRVAYTAAPIASSHPMSEIQEGEELLDDPAPLLGPDSVFIFTRLKSSIAPTGKTTYRVREFSKDDLAPLSQFDLDLSTVADGRARVTSLMYWNGGILMALATTVSDQEIREDNDDGARSDIILITMRPDWTFDPQSDVHTLTAEPDDRENYVSGFETDGTYFYLTYKQSVGQPPSGEHVAWIKIFDKDFNPAHAERVKSAVWGPGGGEMRPSLEVSGNRILSGQSGGQGLGQGNAEIWVYQISTPQSPLPTAAAATGDSTFEVSPPTETRAAYISFIINVHDWINTEDSADILLQLVDLFERYNVRGDFYFTAEVTRKLAEERPDVIERFKNSDMTISYHIRPPHPLYTGFDSRLQNLSDEELYQTLLDYETFALNLETGELDRSQPGGYTYVAQVFGRNPVVAPAPNNDPRIKDAAQRVYASLGAQMTLLYHESGTKAEQPYEYVNGMLVRPSDFSVTRTTSIDGTDNFWWNFMSKPEADAYNPTEMLQSQLAEWGSHNYGRAPFITSLIHENNYYRSGAESWTGFYFDMEGAKKGNPLSPPFDLNAPDPSRPRTEEDKAAIFAAYEELVAYAAANLTVVTSEDILEMAK